VAYDAGMSVSSTQLCQEAGVSYRQLDYWRRSGVFSWLDDVYVAPGSGSRIEWAPADVRVLSILGAYQSLAGGSASCVDLACLAEIVRKHETGFAVKRADEWVWCPMVSAGSGDGGPFVVVPVGA
jgi:hypothetical protein